MLSPLRILGVALVGLTALHLSSSPAEADMVLVFPQGSEHLGIPAAGIRSIEAVRYSPKLAIFEVEICFSRYFAEKICGLTRRSVGQPMEIKAGCELVASPVVRGPMICSGGCFNLTADDLPGAQRLVAKLRDGVRKTCSSPSS